MTTTGTTTDATRDLRAAAYLDEVRRHLADLPADERDDVVDDLDAHVHEVAAGTDRPLDEVLGPPAAFADELLASAGLEEVGDASVYGTLRRLFRAGALSSYVVPSDEGPHRKYYALTTAGREALATGSKTWRHFADVLDDLLGTHGRAAA